MRVITGSARGAKLATLDSDATRPTSDKVKEAIFSMIQFDLEGRTVLDLFGGSGQLAIEALSRGAEKAVIVDSSREATAIIIENAKKTKLFDRCRVSTSDYAAFLRGAAGREKFNLIFLDPPYNTALLRDSLAGIAKAGILSDGGIIVTESDTGFRGKPSKSKKETLLSDEAVIGDVFSGDRAAAGAYTILKTKIYGRTRVTLLSLGGKDGENE
ncbi:MAG: 16S rRNA (guanine(966)-N(2))-methyltransferase RsmD [Clostridia bacterium]|nr:16S rRNA (guanine(966)-N(2))-methyltransferase RsmD [Clostridia bacterium]